LKLADATLFFSIQSIHKHKMHVKQINLAKKREKKQFVPNHQTPETPHMKSASMPPQAFATAHTDNPSALTNKNNDNKNEHRKRHNLTASVEHLPLTVNTYRARQELHNERPPDGFDLGRVPMPPYKQRDA
jgi:hypothetical protein